MFISYAQNFEDVMLWRALRGVENGFYLDVGAADPTDLSVTRAFYERGWHGINIEPTSEYFEKLSRERPRDTNLQCLAGSAPGQADLYCFANTGLSTTDPEIAARHVAEGFEQITLKMPVRTLAEICADHAVPEIHFAKIDVEGAEADVLRGADFKLFRPWILVIEATDPLSTELSYRKWDDLVLGNGYTFEYFDGLNRFYVAAERSELRAAFRAPPNVFDEFVHCDLANEKAATAALRSDVAQRDKVVAGLGADIAARDKLVEGLNAEVKGLLGEAARNRVTISNLQSEIDQISSELADVVRRLTDTDQQLNAVYGSSSWVITRPLRFATRAIRKPRDMIAGLSRRGTPDQGAPLKRTPELQFEELSVEARNIYARLKQAAGHRVGA